MISLLELHSLHQRFDEFLLCCCEMTSSLMLKHSLFNFWKYFQKSFNEGKVYVYANEVTMKLLTSDLKRSGKSLDRSRFGSSIANLGDLQKDGFEDFAVGAPYELHNGMHVGAVYIYRGSKKPKETLTTGNVQI